MLSRIFNLFPWILIFIFMLTGSAQVVPHQDDLYGRLQPYLRGIRFDFAAWVFDASWTKLEQISVGSPHYMDRATRKHLVAEFFRLTGRIFEAEDRLSQIFSDPKWSYNVE